MSDSPATAATVLATPARLRLPVPGAGLVGVGVFALFLANGNALLNDPDTQWHLAVGRWIGTMRAVPWTDPFSHTFAGAPWIAKEWLAQVLFQGAHALAGWWGVVCLAAAAASGTIALLYGWLRRRMQPTAALAAALAALVVAAPHILARPHLLALPVLVGWMIGLVAALRRGTAPSPWLPLAIAVWANLHASYPLGLAAAALLAGEGVLASPAAARRRLAVRWAGFLALSGAAAFATPYGAEPIVVTLRLFGGGESIRYIQEWRPLSLDASGLFALATLAASLGLLLGGGTRDLFRLLLVAILGGLMIRHARFETTFVLVALILCADRAASRFEALRAGPPPEPWTRGAGLCCALALALAAGLAALRPFHPSPFVTPAAALEAARAAAVTGPVYNDYDFGGFLIAQGVRTFVDGRSDQLFLGGFMTRLDEAVAAGGDTPFSDLLDRYGVGWALVRPDSGEFRHLSALPGWTRVHADAVSAVFRRR